MLVPNQSFSTVNTSWDWELIDGKPKTVVIWCLENRTADNGLPNGDSWMQVLSTAAQMWNDANTGWTFKPTSEGTDNEGKLDRTCQVVLAVMDHNSKGGAKADRGYLNPDGTGPVKRIRIAVDPTPISNDKNHPGPTTWDIENGLDPVDVIAHELGHTLRLTHPTDRLGSTNMMDPRKVGTHIEGLSQNDTDEAKASIDRIHHPRTTNQTVINRSDHNCATPFPIYDSEGRFSSNDFEISIPPQDLDGNIPMTCSPFFAYVPNMDNVPIGVNPVRIAFEINSSLQTLQQPATIKIPYADTILQDPELYPYNGIDPSLLKAYFMSSDGRWQPVIGPQNLDTVNKVLTFQVSDLSPKFFGITGVQGPNQLGDLTGTSGVKSIGLLPNWIKHTALWWSEGYTSDKEYASSIGWLTTNQILNLQSRGTLGSSVVVSDSIMIPSSIKNDASWWAAGAINDATYLQSLQYMLDNNIITFSRSNNEQTQTSSSTSYDVALKILDPTTGLPVDAIVTIIGNSHHPTQSTDRDGIVHFSLPSGDYQVQIDGQNYKRLHENLIVTGNTEHTYQPEQIQSSATNPTPPATNPPATIPPGTTLPSTTPPQVSASPTTLSFTHNIGLTACPESIGQSNLQSNQQGTWSVLSNPSWTGVTIKNNMVVIVFNCQLSQYVTQTLTGNVQIQFTGSDGQTGTASISILGQVNKG